MNKRSRSKKKREPMLRPFTLAYHHATGKKTVRQMSGPREMVDGEYVRWLEEELEKSLRREEVLQGVRE